LGDAAKLSRLGIAHGLRSWFHGWPFVGVFIGFPTLTLNIIVYVGLLESPFPTNFEASQLLAFNQSEYGALTKVQNSLHLLDVQ
jgi:hypothetical protein